MESSKSSVTVLAILLFVLAALTHAVAAQKAMEASEHPGMLDRVELLWLATTDVAELSPINLTGISHLKIEVREFRDLRQNPTVVGENRMFMDQGLIKQVTTQDDVGNWTSSHVEALLRDFGFRTVAEGGDVVLSGEVRRLMVTETGAYRGEVGLFLQAVGSDGGLRFEGTTGGVVRRFGRPYDSHNYVEALSEALLEAVHRVISTPDFREALAAG